MKSASLMALVLLTGASGQGYRLARSPEVGQTARYRLNVEIDLHGLPVTFTGVITEKVLAVGDGKFTVSSVQKEAKAKQGALEQALPDSEVDSAVFYFSGEPAEIKTNNEGGARGRMSRLNAFVAPERDVKVGDSWSHTFAPNTLSGGVGGKANYKIEALDRFAGKQALRVQFDFKETRRDLPAESKGTQWIDVATGELLKLESDWKNVPMFTVGAPDSPNAAVNAKVSLLRE